MIEGASVSPARRPRSLLEGAVQLKRPRCLLNVPSINEIEGVLRVFLAPPTREDAPRSPARRPQLCIRSELTPDGVSDPNILKSTADGPLGWGTGHR